MLSQHLKDQIQAKLYQFKLNYLNIINESWTPSNEKARKIINDNLISIDKQIKNL